MSTTEMDIRMLKPNLFKSTQKKQDFCTGIDINNFPRSIINQSELQVYIADFGKKDDWRLVAEIKEKIVGTALNFII